MAASVAKVAILVCIYELVLVRGAPGNPLISIDGQVKILKQRLDDEVNARTKLEERINHIELMYGQAFTELSRRVDDVDAKTAALSTDVAFYAQLTTSIPNIPAWDVIKFSKVLTNIGGGYDGTTGKFTAPTSGTYVFFSNILSAADKNIETALQVNGAVKLLLYSGGSSSTHGPGSNMAVLKLKIGDVVNMVKNGPWGDLPFYIHHGWSTFSGFLVKPDFGAPVLLGKPL